MVRLQLCLPSSPGKPLTPKSKSVHGKRCPLKLPSSVFISNSYPILPVDPSATDQTQTQRVAAIIFGDGSESKSRLYPLTKRRSEGAIPIAANYRLIDAVVSNCINSNINKIYALTQFNSTSLNSHLTRAYSGVGLGGEGIVQVIAAYQSPAHHDKGSWFQGSADAVRKCMWILEDEYPVTEFLLLPGHHLYRMDYQQLIKAHRTSKADITIAASSVSTTHDPEFGFLELDCQNQVSAFRFKFKDGKWISFASVIGNLSDIGRRDLPSMGIYLINKGVMKRLLDDYFPKANDLASEVIPGAIAIGMKVEAHVFDGYWDNIRSIEQFYKANMESIREERMGYNTDSYQKMTQMGILVLACGSFCDRQVPVYTLPRCLPPTLVTDAVITDSLIGEGCIINRCIIRGTVVGMSTRIGDGAVIEDSVIIGSDVYQEQEEENDVHEGMRKQQWDMIPIGIGQQSRLRKAIVDKNAKIGNNVVIINKDKVQEGDGEANGYVIREGIVVILRNAVIPDGTIL
ncbi:Glucose-1-phosphate adenylyltransferase [Parasponia andersonii]|uniref:Glucose-1-phosphate adenylyltransferase n=1 Tax=Parasponia andersonii TaxID=3476 RepID=A0A2P5C6K5_PARAD|nr:Glucose-1-phosphate adenylyltransferase [Parasponia andersonii]